MTPLKKQNQHELPVLYLEAFCDPKEHRHLWVFTRTGAYSPSMKRGKGNPWRSGIHQTSAALNRYAGRKFDGTFDVEWWEEQLQKREHAVDGVLARIRGKEPFAQTDKELFTDYLLMMWLRVSKRWKETEKRARARVSAFDFDRLAREFAFAGSLTGARQIYDAKAFLTSNAGIKHLLLESMLEEMKLCRGAILAMTWNFICAPAGTLFVTCDAPFMFDEALGLQASHVLFPVSPEIMLVAGHGDPVRPPYETISSDEALKLNTMTMFSAHREVYSPTPDEWIYNAWNYGVTFNAAGGRINSSAD